VQEVPGSNPGGPTKFLKDLPVTRPYNSHVWSPDGVHFWTPLRALCYRRRSQLEVPPASLWHKMLLSESSQCSKVLRSSSTSGSCSTASYETPDSSEALFSYRNPTFPTFAT